MSTVIAALGNVFLFFLIFGLSVTVDFSNFREQIKNVKAIGIGCFLQFVVLPAIGFAVVKMLDLSFEYGIALLIITASPGGAYSNW
jgi:BASS family bile acid:Na+ symporter